MTKKVFTVDLANIAGNIFIGRRNGEAVRKLLRLETISPETHRIVIRSKPGLLAINSSFFLGVFGPDIARTGSPELFFEYIDVGGLPEAVKGRIVDAVYRNFLERGAGA